MQQLCTIGRSFFLGAFCVLGICFFSLPVGWGQAGNVQLNLGARIQPLGDENVFRDPDYFNWGASILRGEDGTYHLFYARWPRAYGFTGWLTHSEVAHAVSDDPAGPYTYLGTVLQGRRGEYWDAITAHNPKIKYFEGKYYLYYIGTHAEGYPMTEEKLVEVAHTGYSHPLWTVLRENQRTGVAVASSLDGPWERLDAPIIEPSGPITTLTVNPAIARGPDGTYFLIIKGDKPNETRFIRHQAMATAPSPTGPFSMQSRPVIDYMDTEDVSLWYDDEDRRFYAIFHAHDFIGLITSADGLSWEKAEYFEVTKKRLQLQEGSLLQPDRMERPFVLVEEGKPRVLCLAVKKGDDSYTVFVPLEW